MWISGRRAVRPDRDYYRNVRRIRLRRPGAASRKVSIVGAIVTFVTLLVALGIWLIVKR
jgi:hypothetical protein